MNHCRPHLLITIHFEFVLDRVFLLCELKLLLSIAQFLDVFPLEGAVRHAGGVGTAGPLEAHHDAFTTHSQPDLWRDTLLVALWQKNNMTSWEMRAFTHKEKEGLKLICEITTLSWLHGWGYLHNTMFSSVQCSSGLKKWKKITCLPNNS